MAYDHQAAAPYPTSTHQAYSSDSNMSYMHESSLDGMAPDSLLSHSPSGSGPRTCTDPRLLHSDSSFWTPAQGDEFSSHDPDLDADLDAGPTTRIGGAYKPTPTSAFNPDQWTDDPSHVSGHSNWAAENSMYVAGNMFANAGDATGDILTPPDSGACDSPSPVDDASRNQVRSGDYYSSHARTSSSGRIERSNSPYLRHDGYKKKNAKFDIPADRNLQNIDELIEKAKARGDEKNLKEFKTQKRLLRNREAALHSRQKKKDYTSMLEVQVKQLEAELGAVNAAHKQQIGDSNYLSGQLQQVSAHAMHVEGERNMLQNKVAMLEQTLCAASPAMSSGPTPPAYGDKFDVHGWTNTADATQSDQSIALTNTDAVLMLLMSGAVNALPANQRPQPPHLPDAALSSAPALLDAIFQRAGISARPFQQSTGNTTGLDRRVTTALGHLVQPDAVALFRRLVTEANTG